MILKNTIKAVNKFIIKYCTNEWDNFDFEEIIHTFLAEIKDSPKGFIIVTGDDYMQAYMVLETFLNHLISNDLLVSDMISFFLMFMRYLELGVDYSYSMIHTHWEAWHINEFSDIKINMNV